MVDALTPELAELATSSLADRLSQDKSLFSVVYRPDGGPFFQQNGLLFLPESDLKRITDQVIAAQPLLGPLAADPSLRGLMDVFSRFVEGVQHGQAKLSDLDRPIVALADTLQAVVDAKFHPLAWSTLFTGELPRMRELRRFTERHADWMGLALSASQARSLIQAGKLAVVAGVEVDSLDSLLGSREGLISALIDWMCEESERQVRAIATPVREQIAAGHEGPGCRGQLAAGPDGQHRRRLERRDGGGRGPPRVAGSPGSDAHQPAAVLGPGSGGLQGHLRAVDAGLLPERR